MCLLVSPTCIAVVFTTYTTMCYRMCSTHLYHFIVNNAHDRGRTHTRLSRMNTTTRTTIVMPFNERSHTMIVFMIIPHDHKRIVSPQVNAGSHKPQCIIIAPIADQLVSSFQTGCTHYTNTLLTMVASRTRDHHVLCMRMTRATIVT